MEFNRRFWFGIWFGILSILLGKVWISNIFRECCLFYLFSKSFQIWSSFSLENQYKFQNSYKTNEKRDFRKNMILVIILILYVRELVRNFENHPLEIWIPGMWLLTHRVCPSMHGKRALNVLLSPKQPRLEHDLWDALLIPSIMKFYHNFEGSMVWELRVCISH